MATDEGSTGNSFAITDSEVNIGDRAGTGVGAVNFTATRVHVTGGNRSMHCWHDCTITDSYVHAQFTDPPGTFHESGIRMGQSATLRHNSIFCDAPDVPPDGGCSAGLTGYGDFGPVQNNLIERNLFGQTTGGFCTYGGSTAGKPYVRRHRPHRLPQQRLAARHQRERPRHIRVRLLRLEHGLRSVEAGQRLGGQRVRRRTVVMSSN